MTHDARPTLLAETLIPAAVDIVDRHPLAADLPMHVVAALAVSAA